MAAVGDRMVLATGGFTGESTGGESQEPSDQAWMYDVASDTWRILGRLATARADHIAIPTLDERIVIVGGVATGGPLAAIGEGVDCSEVYDPSNDTWSVGGCSATGSGANPAVGVDALHGALVLSGADELGGGARTYGIVPFSPVGAPTN